MAVVGGVLAVLPVIVLARGQRQPNQRRPGCLHRQPLDRVAVNGRACYRALVVDRHPRAEQLVEHRRVDDHPHQQVGRERQRVDAEAEQSAVMRPAASAPVMAFANGHVP